MIQMININKLHPHPDNPRQDLGDLTELVDSIKANGVLQNLTVVPWYSQITGVGCDDPKQQEKMGYIVVIGHRRLAAAKQAGLNRLPCSIAEMDKKTQVATMLLENIQRSDLTVYEQAQGFQMMLDLGDTVSKISDKTGFSQTTVRRRVKLMELDQDKFKASEFRCPTLMDYAELEKIEDINLRNEVLDHIGTPNFRYELQKAIDKEKSAKGQAALIEQLNTFATEIKDRNGLRYVDCWFDFKEGDKIETPEDAGTVKYFYTIPENRYDGVTLFKEGIKTETPTVDEQQKRLQEKISALEKITKRALKLRREFIQSVSNAKAKDNLNTIIEHNIYATVSTCYGYSYEELAEFFDLKSNAEFFDLKSNDEDEWEFGDIVESLRQKPALYLLVSTYCMLEDEYQSYYDFLGQHDRNEELDRVYDLLEVLGYEISDEEKALRDGTHELLAAENSAERK